MFVPNYEEHIPNQCHHKCLKIGREGGARGEGRGVKGERRKDTFHNQTGWVQCDSAQ